MKYYLIERKNLWQKQILSAILFGSFLMSESVAGNDMSKTLSKEERLVRAIKEQNELEIEKVITLKPDYTWNDEQKLSLLHWAIHCNNVNLVETILEKMDSETKSLLLNTRIESVMLGKFRKNDLLSPDGFYILKADGVIEDVRGNYYALVSVGEHKVWHPDSRRFLTENDGIIDIFNVEGKLLKTLTLPDGGLFGAMWNPQGTLLVASHAVSSTFNKKKIILYVRNHIIWDDRGEKRISEFSGNDLGPKRWSPDGNHLFFMGFVDFHTLHSCSYLCDLKGKVKLRLMHKDLSTAEFNSAGTLMYTIEEPYSAKGMIKVWSMIPDALEVLDDLDKNMNKRCIVQLSNFEVKSVKWSPVGSLLLLVRVNGNVSMVKIIGEDHSIKEFGEAKVINAAWNSDATLVLMYCSDQHVRVLDSNTNEIIRDYRQSPFYNSLYGSHLLSLVRWENVRFNLKLGIGEKSLNFVFSGLGQNDSYIIADHRSLIINAGKKEIWDRGGSLLDWALRVVVLSGSLGILELLLKQYENVEGLLNENTLINLCRLASNVRGYPEEYQKLCAIIDMIAQKPGAPL